MNVPELHALFHAQHAASRSQTDVPLVVRRERLLRLRKLLQEHRPVLKAAVEADFGMRSPRLTDLVELFVLEQHLDHTLRHLARWMKPQRVGSTLALWPAHGEIRRQPLGVVGVIAPWNYPLQLSFGPALAALAAGNRVILKPSELTPHTSAQMADLVQRFFAPEEMAVVQGDAGMAAALAALPLDHLVFTGSTAVGRKVAQAAAAHLTPTTLELGGKSPCILDASCDVAEAALRIANGKLLNAGQTCIAPDYVLLPRGMEAGFAEHYRQAVQRLYPTVQGNPDYASILTPRHHARLRTMLQQAQTLGAQVQEIDPAPDRHPQAGASVLEGALARQMLPTLVFGATSDMQLMQEEIFGPVLPVVTYERLDDAIAHIQNGPRPLALYWFGTDRAPCEAVLQRTVSGGVTVNDTLMHFVHARLPFGGVGDSGWGAYHGEAGFLRFSHQKSVLKQRRWSLTWLTYPPFGPRLDRILGLLRRRS